LQETELVYLDTNIMQITDKEHFGRS